ncbi:unnamed protein product [Arabidopsis thaliana]|uniref:Uncharacterized protein n=1 Tax=Arabidopsis thaliana TaxID=3702 RepID=A0A5S9X5D3_ARATH|nr:unnamed protein product [Arabidopsis thaliana]
MSHPSSSIHEMSFSYELLFVKRYCQSFGLGNICRKKSWCFVYEFEHLKLFKGYTLTRMKNGTNLDTKEVRPEAYLSLFWRNLTEYKILRAIIGWPHFHLKRCLLKSFYSFAELVIIWVSLPIRPIPSSSLHFDQHLLDHQHWSWDMDQGLGIATYRKHDLSLLWPISLFAEQCGLHSNNDLYQKNNRSSCLRLVV